MDFVAYDNYPVWGGSLAPNSPSLINKFNTLSRHPKINKIFVENLDSSIPNVEPLPLIVNSVD